MVLIQCPHSSVKYKKKILSDFEVFGLDGPMYLYLVLPIEGRNCLGSMFI